MAQVLLLSKFHIVLKMKNDNSWKCIFKDLSEVQVRDDFIEPFKRGKVIVNNELISTKDIYHVVISKTNMTHRDELKKVQIDSYQKLQEMNENGSAINVEAGRYDYEIKDCGKDITSNYLYGGAEMGEESNIFKNPVVFILTGGFLVAILIDLYSYFSLKGWNNAKIEILHDLIYPTLDILNYLIYPIAGFLVLLGLCSILGRLITKDSNDSIIVTTFHITTSIAYLCLHVYAIYAFIWWPIMASIVASIILQKIVGEPESPQ